MVKGIVKRGVIELVTPGVTFNEQVLIPKIIFAFSTQRKEKFGIAPSDVFTGEFLVAEGNLEKLLHIVHTLILLKLFTKELPKFLLNLKKQNCFKLGRLGVSI